jgi:hypothetical protein
MNHFPNPPSPDSTTNSEYFQVEFESSGIIGDEGAKMHSSNAVSASTAGNPRPASHQIEVFQ